MRLSVITQIGKSGWWPAFTMGVYGVILFEQHLALWAAATITIVMAAARFGGGAAPAHAQQRRVLHQRQLRARELQPRHRHHGERHPLNSPRVCTSA